MAYPIFAILVGLLIWQCRRWYKRQSSLPPDVKTLPGPMGLPFIGRVHDIPVKGSWLQFYEWSKTYGPIYQMEIFGSTHIWISSNQIANDLLSRRGSIYSDRPQIANLPDNQVSGKYLALSGKNDTWVRQRRFGTKMLQYASNRGQYGYPVLERTRLLYNLSQDPAGFKQYLEEYTSRAASHLSWGDASHAPQLRINTMGLLQAISPGGELPNAVTWLAKLPKRLSPWKKTEEMRQDKERSFLSNIFQTIKDETFLSLNEAPASHLKYFLKSDQKDGLSEMEVSYVAGMMAIASALTMASPMMSFILAMWHSPETQTRLQSEIETVCQGRCPEFSDKERMPYLRAVVNEVLRWRPPVPTGIPHMLEEDDIYNGYHIPAGATIHALEWAIAREPSVYPDPETFRPERWLDPAYPTYREPLTQYPTVRGHHQFGHGRRVCMGMDIVEQELFLAMGGMAWAFEIGKKRDSNGQIIDVNLNDFGSLLIAKPENFQIEMKPRNERILNDIKAEWEALSEEDFVVADEKQKN